MSPHDAYSKVGNAQLNELEFGNDPDLYTAVLDTCELIFRFPGRARSISTAIATNEGARLRLPVLGKPPFKVFWSTEGTRTEAVFPHP